MFIPYTDIMKANNLTISIYTPKCKKGCPFCISRMTGELPYNKDLYWRNLDKVKTIALFSGTSSILITSKGEPLDNHEDTLRVINYFDNLHFPVELQTNGLLLIEKPKLLSTLYKSGLNIIALSIRNPSDLSLLRDVALQANRENLIVRLTIVLNNEWKDESFHSILKYCKETNVRQLTFRLPTIPEVYADTKESMLVRQWISNQNSKHWKQILDTLNFNATKSNMVRELSFGAKVHDVEGVGITVMDYCIQENSKENDLRSLIYQTDGHLYTTWDKKGSILF